MLLEKALRKAQNLWQGGIEHPAYGNWQTIARKCEKVADGDTWESESPKHLKFNIISGYLNSLIGENLKTRTSVSVKSHDLLSDGNSEIDIVGLTEQELDESTRGFNAKLYRTYEELNVPYYQNRSMYDSLIYGMGAGFFDYMSGKKVYRRINPLYIVFDAMDESVGFEHSEFVGQLVSLPIFQALQTFPKLKPLLSGYDDGYKHHSVSPVDVMSAQAVQSSYITDGRYVYIKMIEWKAWETSYTALAANGRSFTVFDEEIAHKNALSPREIQEGKSERIHRAYFTGDTLLDYAPLKMSFPRDQFSIVLTCLAKKSVKGGFYRPKPLVEDLIDSAKSFNMLTSKSIFLSLSKKLALDPSVLNQFGKESPEKIKASIRDEFESETTSVLLIGEPQKNVHDLSLKYDINQMMSASVEITKVFDLITGINREQRGLPTNAHTGIAIKERQMQAITSNYYAFNEFTSFKKKVGRLFLQTLQQELLGIENAHFPAHPIKSGNVILNRRQEGSSKLINDINFLNLDVYIEESPEFLSSKEEQRELLMQLMQLPPQMVMMFLSSDSLRSLIGLNIDPRITEEVQKFIGGQMQESSPSMQGEDTSTLAASII